MAYTHWSDVMGNNLAANEVVKDWKSHCNPGESLPAWLERSSREMWGTEHQSEDWQQMAQDIEEEAKTRK